MPAGFEIIGASGLQARPLGDGAPVHIRSPGNLARLRRPSDELGLVQLIALADVEVADVLVLGLTGREGRSEAPRKNATFTYFVKQ